ncbi:MAG: hypothetical protein JWQ71_4175 [Pedosphaera sp.]|nr:hypothetical protein [Pedosphaera sp.]
MIKWLTIICVGLLVLPAGAQVNPADSFAGELQRMKRSVHSSVSRQFVIFEPSESDPFPRTSPNANLVRLDPDLLAISCERIKKALLAELGLSDQWHAKINLQLHPFQTPDEAVVVTTVKFGNQWNYRVDLPDRMESSRFITAIVDVLLLEMADRAATARSAEIPAWLTQGMAQHLMLSSGMDLLLRPPSEMESGISIGRTDLSAQRVNPLTQAHTDLRNMTPLSLEQLSWPQEGQLNGEAGEAYRNCAQVFVFELLRLKDGRICMRNFIAALPQHLNWQISFIKGFQSHFTNQRDLEKWWALRMVEFTGRDLSHAWPSAESFKKLDEVIRPPVEVRTAADQLPMRTEVTLQAIIRDWDFTRQAKILNTKLQQLALLRNQVSQEAVSLVDAYRKTVESYLKNRNKAGFARLTRATSTPGLDKLAQQTLKELDALDLRREELRPKEPAESTAKTDTASTLVNH